MSGTYEDRSGWGMRASDGRLVHVQDVRRGLDCGCLCPACASPLIARQGRNRIWHFAHASEVDCNGSGETALHKAAKQTLQNLNGRICIPEETIRKSGWPAPSEWVSKPMAKLNDLMTHVFPERQLEEWNVRIEPKDWTDQGFRPDAVLEKDGRSLLIEICVSNGVNEEKRKRLKKAGIGTIQIDLSGSDRSASPDELAKLLISEAPREWLVTGRKKACTEWEAEFTKRLETEASRLSVMIPRELTQNLSINACPRRDESGFETVDVYQCLDCDFCGGHLHNLRETPLWNRLVDLIKFADENSILCAHRGNPHNLPTEKQKGFVRYLAQSDLEREGGLTEWLPNGWERSKTMCDAFISAHPDCGICKKKLALRRNNRGQFFWGCSNYPSCRGTASFVSKHPLDTILTMHELEQRREQEENKKVAAERATLSRPEADQNSLSNLARPLTRLPTKD